MNMGGGAGIAGENTTASVVTQFSHTVWQRYQHLLDKSTPFVLYRWIFLSAIAFMYALRIYIVQGFYITTYGLGIYILQLLIAFLSPQVDPEIHQLADGPTLPTRGSDEFRPFVRRLPEFKFWFCPVFEQVEGIFKIKLNFLGMDLLRLLHCIFMKLKVHGKKQVNTVGLSFVEHSLTKAFCFVFVLTFFSAFDVPVFWPILLFYWLILFISTMKRQIMHMMKYKYVPFTFGKQRYHGKKTATAEETITSRP